MHTVIVNDTKQQATNNDTGLLVSRNYENK